MAGKSYNVVGMMSGTSLDGVDLVLCQFHKEDGRWKYRIVRADTFEYQASWKNKLQEASRISAIELLLLHNEYGAYIGELIRHFLMSDKTRPDLVASHGHTIFHQPQQGFTFQLGSGAVIASACQITTVSDFRTTDVALGGQGAPLVPVGDEWLFHEYTFCLNLGGFANISNLKNGIRIASDICPVNIVANYLSGKAGYNYDPDGNLGRRGTMIPELVNRLNELAYYKRSGPKSLGREWIESAFLPILSEYESPVEDLLRSVYEHMADQISKYLNSYEKGTVLVTGGGAFNTYLMQKIQQKTGSALIVPDSKLVQFKEALIFAFMGLLRYLNEINCFSSVTGARCDSSCGVVHLYKAPQTGMEHK